MIAKYLQIGDSCTGCMACFSQCQVGAISIEERDGFYYPSIDEEACVECGTCERACPVIGFQKGDRGEWTPVQEADCYIGWHNDPEIRRVSSSGGIFTACAEQVLGEGGVVFGAAYDENMVIRHVAVETRGDLEPLRGSKYAQSDTSKIYEQIKRHLVEGRKVLFCGTPCQIAALRWVFPRVKYPQLVLISLACMAVASPVVFRHYVSWLERKYHDKLVNLAFRTKKYGWSVGMLIAKFRRKGEKTLILKEAFFMRAFLKYCLLRPSCPGCTFRSGSSGADLTIGDFWYCHRFFEGARGWRKRLGFSGIVVYSPFGERLLAENGRSRVYSVPVHELIDYNKGWLPKLTVRCDAKEFLHKFEDDPECKFMSTIVPLGLREYIVTLERHFTFGWWFPISRSLSRIHNLIATIATALRR